MLQGRGSHDGALYKSSYLYILMQGSVKCSGDGGFVGRSINTKKPDGIKESSDTIEDDSTGISLLLSCYT